MKDYNPIQELIQSRKPLPRVSDEVYRIGSQCYSKKGLMAHYIGYGLCVIELKNNDIKYRIQEVDTARFKEAENQDFPVSLNQDIYSLLNCALYAGIELEKKRPRQELKNNIIDKAISVLEGYKK